MASGAGAGLVMYANIEERLNYGRTIIVEECLST